VTNRTCPRQRFFAAKGKPGTQSRHNFAPDCEINRLKCRALSLSRLLGGAARIGWRIMTAYAEWQNDGTSGKTHDSK